MALISAIGPNPFIENYGLKKISDRSIIASITAISGSLTTPTSPSITAYEYLDKDSPRMMLWIGRDDIVIDPSGAQAIKDTYDKMCRSSDCILNLLQQEVDHDNIWNTSSIGLSNASYNNKYPFDAASLFINNKNQLLPVEINNIIYTLDSVNKTASITGNSISTSDSSINIPVSIIVDSDEYNIISICNSAFYNCIALTSIIIPNNIRYIGDSAFDRCSALISITIPDGITFIGNKAFDDCTSSLYIYIKTNTSKYLNIFTNVFNNINNSTIFYVPYKPDINKITFNNIEYSLQQLTNYNLTNNNLHNS